jgi:hypothetical protein
MTNLPTRTVAWLDGSGQEQDEARIIRFGTISEDDDGTLRIDGFDVTGEEDQDPHVAVLRAVIRRLEGALAVLNAH